MKSTRAEAAKNRRERPMAAVEPRRRSNVNINSEASTIQSQAQHQRQPVSVTISCDTDNLDPKKTHLLGSLKDLTINNNGNDMTLVNMMISPKRKSPPEETDDSVDDNVDTFSFDGYPFEVDIDFDVLDRDLGLDEDSNDNQFKRRKWNKDEVGGDDLSQIDLTGFLDMMKKSAITSTNVGSKADDLQSRGLQHFDLGSSSEVEEIKEGICINLDFMSELMMDAVSSLQYPFLNPYEHPVDVDTIYGTGRARWSCNAPSLADECRAILLLVANHCLTNIGSPRECVKPLFPDFETVEPGPSDGDCKTWRLLAIAGSSDLPYFRWLCEGEENSEDGVSSPAGSTGFWRVTKWARRMSKIMTLSLGSDTSHYALRKVGYILGFWMFKLFMQTDPTSAQILPNELLYTKERFLEIHGHHFENAMIFPMPF